LLASHAQRLLDENDPQLLAVGADQPDLAGPNAFVDARRLVDTQLTPWERRRPRGMRGASMILPASAGPRAASDFQ